MCQYDACEHDGTATESWHEDRGVMRILSGMVVIYFFHDGEVQNGGEHLFRQRSNNKAITMRDKNNHRKR
jgi:hypothetical protein